MINIEENKQYRISFHHLGFRPFFLLGSLYAVITVLLWFLQYQLNLLFPSVDNLPVIYWHGHEMIFGYGMAVIAGFLLTAVRNWTNVQTLNGIPLLALALMWLLARLVAWVDHSAAIPVMALLDLGFGIFLCLALAHPVIKAKQWGQLGIIFAVMLIVLANLLFYTGMMGQISRGMELGLYAGIYFIIALILLMGRRVIPFFIEKGVDETIQIKNPLWLDNAGIVLMLGFIYLQVFTSYRPLASGLAFGLFLIHSWRLYIWHSKGIWQKPLLWILYIAYAFITLGFCLTGLSNLGYLNPMLALHTFGYGGMGLMTLGMMARVALGHTGRNVFDPPAVLKWIFALATAGALARVVLPALSPGLHAEWIGLSQLLWCLAFGLFTLVYSPMLIKPRVDGRYG